MIKTRSDEDRQSLLETGDGRIQKQNNNNNRTVTIKAEMGGAEGAWSDGGAVQVRKMMEMCVFPVCVCVHVAEVRRN